MKKFLSILFFVGFLGLSLQGFGQGATTSSITGTVVDEGGSGIPGATVLVIHKPSGTQQGVVSDLDGGFRLLNLRVGGPYQVTVSFIGYEHYDRTNIYLQLGQAYQIDATLSESTTTLEGVEIIAESGDIFDGNRTGTETNISENTIATIPTASRGIADYVRVTPQANLIETGDGPAISVAGQNNRFNAIFIDGAVNNDVFGLAGSGTNGGQTGMSPISPDAIEQFQVAVSPYDVTLGGFTGAGINAVTRSGDNTFRGSAYWFHRNESFAGKTPTDVGGFERTRLEDFSANTVGFRLGGPIIENKLFFFVNVERQVDETSQPFNIASYEGQTNTLEAIENLRNQVQNFTGYELGTFQNNVREQKSTRFLAKIDWNINQTNTLTFRHSYTFAEELEADPSTDNQILFAGGSELFPSHTNSTAIEWKSTFSSNLFNKMTIGYTRVRDDRGFVGNPFPRVDIYDGPATDLDESTITFGSEPFSSANDLEQDIFTFTNNLTWFKGKHTVTFGTHNEFYSIYNLFIAQNYGAYEYNSLNDFLTGVAPAQYTRGYAVFPTVDAQVGDAATDVAAVFSAAQLGFYIQDEFQVSDRLKLTGGLRMDIPFFLDNPEKNEDFANDALPTMLATWGYAADAAVAGEVPDTQYLFSPRFGFNYDVLGDRTLQLRGGLGIFTGRIPFVWPGGSFSNNGVFTDFMQLDDPNLAGGTPLPFRGDVNNQFVSSDIDGGFAFSRNVDVYAKDFKYPQVFRTSLAVDYKLPFGGLVASLEGIYTQRINEIRLRNINVPLPTRNVNAVGDNRPIYEYSRSTAPDNRFNRVILADNNPGDPGYTVNVTASLRKPFYNNWEVGTNYTYGITKVLFDETSSQNSSNWRRPETTDIQNLELGFSDWDLGHRVNVYGSYRQDYGDFGATTLSLFLNAQSGRRYSFTYSGAIGGNANQGSRERGNYQLIYIPRDASEINLIDIVDDGGNIVTSAADQWTALNSFIENDPYLSENRGSIAERNAGRLPFETTLDVKLMQEFYINTGAGRNTLQFTLDIFNFTNLLNKDWGRRRNMSTDQWRIINFEGFEADGVTPQFTFTETDSEKEQANIDDTGIYSSRWQMQFGIRYIFN